MWGQWPDRGPLQEMVKASECKTRPLKSDVNGKVAEKTHAHKERSLHRPLCRQCADANTDSFASGSTGSEENGAPSANSGPEDSSLQSP